jgi:hypothetical protein
MNKQPLTEADLKLLSASFISPDLARSAGIFRVDSPDGAELVGGTVKLITRALPSRITCPAIHTPVNTACAATTPT